MIVKISSTDSKGNQHIHIEDTNQINVCISHANLVDLSMDKFGMRYNSKLDISVEIYVNGNWKQVEILN
jgi:hypothetical protein